MISPVTCFPTWVLCHLDPYSEGICQEKPPWKTKEKILNIYSSYHSHDVEYALVQPGICSVQFQWCHYTWLLFRPNKTFKLIKQNLPYVSPLKVFRCVILRNLEIEIILKEKRSLGHQIREGVQFCFTFLVVFYY